MEAVFLCLGVPGLVVGVWASQRLRASALAVKTLSEAVNELLALLGPPGGVSAMSAAVAYLEDLQEQLSTHNGRLPGSRMERAPRSGRWWWRYTNGVWVVYLVEDSSRWSLRRPVRTVTIVGFEPALPVA